jgi:hypothetical protein
MSETQETSKPTPKGSAFSILGTIGYDKPEDIEKFAASLDIQGSIFLLMHAVNYAQSRGAYSLTEASVIAAAMRKLTKKASDDISAAEQAAASQTPNT